MSDDIKVGDVCQVVLACCNSQLDLVGREVTVTGFEPDRATCAYCGCIHSDNCKVSIAGEIEVDLLPRAWLRKKPPKSDDAEWIRQDTVPREKFERWREHLRNVNKVRETEPA